MELSDSSSMEMRNFVDTKWVSGSNSIVLEAAKENDPEEMELQITGVGSFEGYQ